MARRYGRKRDDGIAEYSDSLSELKASAVRENETAARGTFGRGMLKRLHLLSLRNCATHDDRYRCRSEYSRWNWLLGMESAVVSHIARGLELSGRQSPSLDWSG